MKITDHRALIRRGPQQERSRQTVEAVLDAVERVLKRHGIDAITTNRIAEAAGVSIGSVYQYFPDKRSIFTALHNRHAAEVRQAIERTIAEHGTSSLEDFARALVEALMDVHAADPELHDIISMAVPESAQGFRNALRASFERVIAPGAERSAHASRVLFVLPNLVEALVHGVTQRRQTAHISLESAKEEAVHAVLLYLSACRAGSR